MVETDIQTEMVREKVHCSERKNKSASFYKKSCKGINNIMGIIFSCVQSYQPSKYGPNRGNSIKGTERIRY